MKKLIFAFVLLFLISVTLAYPSITVEKIDPQPVEPGRDVAIDITLNNRLTSSTGDFSVYLDAEFPIVLKTSSEDLSKVNLCPDCKRRSTYFLSISPTAVSGTYPIYVILSSPNEATVRQRIDIRVQGKPNLIFSTESSVNKITPNSQFLITLNVENIGSGQARQIQIKPESNSFIVLGGSVKNLDTINPLQEKQVTFDFISSSDLEATSYSIPFKISYLDEQGTVINTSQNLGVKVVNKGEIDIQTIKIASNAGSPVITAGEGFVIIARLENVGEGDADSINADIACPFNGNKKAFLGQLKKDEDAPAVFNLVSTRSGEFTCKLMVFYEDDLGSHQKEEEFGVSILSPNYSGIIIFIIIILILAFIFRKRIPFLKKKK